MAATPSMPMPTTPAAPTSPVHRGAAPAPLLLDVDRLVDVCEAAVAVSDELVLALVVKPTQTKKPAAAPSGASFKKLT